MIDAYAALKPKAPLEPFSYDPGPLGDHEVELNVSHCGICHSDLSVINNDWNNSVYPLVPGHEAVGTIAKKGDKVRLDTGGVVGLGWHAGFCHHCHACHQGDHNLCGASQASIIGHHGGFARQVRADSRSVVPIPDGMDAASVGPLFCGGITVFNPMVQFNVRPTDKVGVIGIGGLGHMALQFLRAWGTEVTAFTSSESKKAEAIRRLGAHQTFNSNDPNDFASAQGYFDYIISTVNVKLDWNAYLGLLAPKGRLHMVGATVEPLDVSVFPLIMGQRSISGSPVGSPSTIGTMLEFAKRHDIKPVIQTFPLEDVNKALDELKKGNIRYRGVLTM